MAGGQSACMHAQRTANRHVKRIKPHRQGFAGVAASQWPAPTCHAAARVVEASTQPACRWFVLTRAGEAFCWWQLLGSVAALVLCCVMWFGPVAKGGQRQFVVCLYAVHKHSGPLACAAHTTTTTPRDRRVPPTSASAWSPAAPDPSATGSEMVLGPARQALLASFGKGW